MNVALPYPGIGEKPGLQPAKTPAQRLTARHSGKGIRGRPWTNLKKLAQDHTEVALEKLVELAQCDNACVAFGASKLLIERGYGRLPLEHKSIVRRRKPAKEKLNVKITLLGPEGSSDAGRA